MRFKIVLSLFIAFAPLLVKAQGCITIFSEDGDRFFLVLNGERQNPEAQVNVRVDGLTNDSYNVKIIFEGKSKSELSEIVPLKNAEGQFGEMTYKIKKSKDGQLKIRYCGTTPVPANYTAPANVYSMHYVQPVTVSNVVMSTAPNGGNGGVSFTPAGGSVGITPVQNSAAMETTTTTRSQGGSVGIRPIRAATACQTRMDHNTFSSAKTTVANAGYEDTKLSAAENILTANCMNTDQVVAMCKLFGFEETRLKFAKFAYSKTTDPDNYLKVSNIFNSDASKAELNNFISNGGR